MFTQLKYKNNIIIFITIISMLLSFLFSCVSVGKKSMLLTTKKHEEYLHDSNISISFDTQNIIEKNSFTSMGIEFDKYDENPPFDMSIFFIMYNKEIENIKINEISIITKNGENISLDNELVIVYSDRFGSTERITQRKVNCTDKIIIKNEEEYNFITIKPKILIDDIKKFKKLKVIFDCEYIYKNGNTKEIKASVPFKYKKINKFQPVLVYWLLKKLIEYQH